MERYIRSLLCFQKLCAVKRGTHQTIIVTGTSVEASFVWWTEMVQSVFPRDSFLWLTQGIKSLHCHVQLWSACAFHYCAAGQPSFWCFPIASRVDSILTLFFSGPWSGPSSVSSLLWPLGSSDLPCCFRLSLKILFAWNASCHPHFQTSVLPPDRIKPLCRNLPWVSRQNPGLLFLALKHIRI